MKTKAAVNRHIICQTMALILNDTFKHLFLFFQPFLFWRVDLKSVRVDGGEEFLSFNFMEKIKDSGVFHKWQILQINK